MMSGIVERERKNLDELRTYAGEDSVISSTEMELILGQQPDSIVRVKSRIPGIDNAVEDFRDGELIAISGPTKSGKCHGADTMILMYDGSPKPVQNIIPGDILMGDDSTPRMVLSISTGIGELFKVTDKFGESFTANEEHILCLKRTGITNRKKDNLRGSVIEISIKDYLKQSKYMKHIQKAYRVPVEFPEKEVPVDPYFIGLWLGDGSSNEISFTTADDEIVKYLNEFARHWNLDVTVKDQKGNKSKFYRFREKPGYQKGRIGGAPRKTRLQKIFLKLNLFKNKHIPPIYKINSRNNRLKLLAGLIDTDGNTKKTGTLGHGLEYISKSQFLSKDVAWLCRSLGFSASLRRVTKKIKGVNYSGSYYAVRINGPKQEIPCLLQRKLHESYKHKKDILRSCFSVIPIGTGRYYGFEIDGNGRYVLNDFTVTHNTLLAQTLTVNFVKQKYFPLWFTFEVPARQFLSQFREVPMVYMPRRLKSHAMDWVEERIYESFAKYNTRIIFLDHLHYLVDIAKMKNPSLEIGTVIRQLKSIAVNGNFVVFLLCHTKMGKHDENLSYESIRDSSFVSQESDTVFMVKRTPDKGENRARMRVEFHRRTGVMERVVELQKIDGYLREVMD